MKKNFGSVLLALAALVIPTAADDLGWGDVGFHKGNVPTPNLDRLAKESVELLRFYVHPMCSPQKFVAISLFAGLRPAEVQKLDWAEVDLEGGLAG